MGTVPERQGGHLAQGSRSVLDSTGNPPSGRAQVDSATGDLFDDSSAEPRDKGESQGEANGMRTAQPGEVLRKRSLFPELQEDLDRGDAILKDESYRDGKPDAGEEHHGGQDQDPDPGGVRRPFSRRQRPFMRML